VPELVPLATPLTEKCARVSPLATPLTEKCARVSPLARRIKIAVIMSFPARLLPSPLGEWGRGEKGEGEANRHKLQSNEDFLSGPSTE
jgi:hypothetical protein